MTQFQVKDLNDIQTFEQFFKSKIYKKLKKFEFLRVTTLSIYLLLNIVAVLIFFVLLQGDFDLELIIFLCSIIIAIACGVRFFYAQKVKRQIFSLLFKYVGDFEYIDTKKVILERRTYSSIPMFPEFNCEPQVDDCIVGNYKGLSVEIEELCLEYKYRSRNRSHTRTVFSGLLLSFPQLKTTNIVTISKNRRFGYIVGHGNRVTLEDVEYEKKYETFSVDQIEARYMMTPTLMEKMKKLAEKDIIVAICFYAGMVYLAVATGKNMFEPPFFKSSVDVRSYKELITQLREIVGIIDILGMDKKSKL